MKGDFSRDTFDPRKHYKGVRMQQGRVQLDADWNENLDILLYRIETLAMDVIGQCGFPKDHAGFNVFTDTAELSDEDKKRLTEQGVLPLASGDFLLSPGRAYVDGILCEINDVTAYTRQPYIKPEPQAGLTSDGIHLIYLDVWERPITALEDPDIREIALGGPDTTLRSQVIWQVLARKAGATDANLNCNTAIEGWPPQASTGTLCARTHPQAVSDDPCVVAPGAGYKRIENQFYRVEIHQGSGTKDGPTFKWHRNNVSMDVAVEEFNVDGSSDKLRVANLWPDSVHGLNEQDWVEVVGDHCELSWQPGQLRSGQTGQLVQISKIDREQLIVTLKEAVSGFGINLNPKLRRWDSAGELKVETPAGNDGFIPIEDGIEVAFGNGSFNTGDYWCFEARTIPGQYGDIRWPKNGNNPACLLPFGIKHHYCKLAMVVMESSVINNKVNDCRDIFPPLTERPTSTPISPATVISLSSNPREIKLSFSKALQASSVNRSSIEVFHLSTRFPPSVVPVEGQVTYDPTSQSAIFLPGSPLEGSTYFITVRGDEPHAIVDIDNLRLDGDADGIPGGNYFSQFR